MERPGLDQSGGVSGPQTDEGGERGQLRDRLRLGGGDQYRVLLLDHERHTEGLVTKLLPRAVPAVSREEAKRAFLESRALGAGLVLVAPKEHAEMHAQMMARVGLRSTIEPDGPVL